MELHRRVAKLIGPRWIASKAIVGSGLGTSWFKTLFLFVVTCVLFKTLAENEQARTWVWLPVGYEVEVEPDTETELSSDDA